MLAHLARREGVPPSATGATISTPKPEPLANRGKLGGRAGAALAVSKVVAHHEMGGAKAAHDHLACERLSAEPRKRGLEWDDESLVETQRRKQLELHRQRREAEEGLLRREELARMRLEQYGAGAPALSMRRRPELASGPPDGRDGRRRNCRWRAPRPASARAPPARRGRPPCSHPLKAVRLACSGGRPSSRLRRREPSCR